MINDLLNAELVIADLSLSNPNAFYEIGIRHMTQKPIIHMQLATEQTPFDVSLYRAVKFSRARFRDVEKAKEDLTNFVRAVLAPEYQPENPITNAIGRLKLEQTATPEMRLMMDEMKQFRAQLNILQEILIPKPPTSEFTRGVHLGDLYSSGQLGPNASGFGLSSVSNPWDASQLRKGVGMVDPP
jgi:hypothetical protein